MFCNDNKSPGEICLTLWVKWPIYKGSIEMIKRGSQAFNSDMEAISG